VCEEQVSARWCWQLTQKAHQEFSKFRPTAPPIGNETVCGVAFADCVECIFASYFSSTEADLVDAVASKALEPHARGKKG